MSRAFLVGLLLLACGDQKQDKPSPPPAVKQVGSPSCEKFRELLVTLERCVNVENPRYVHIAALKNALDLELRAADPTELAVFCDQQARVLREEFASCITLEKPEPTASPIAH